MEEVPTRAVWGDGFSPGIDAGTGRTPTRHRHFFQVVVVSSGQLTEDRRATLSPQPAPGLASEEELSAAIVKYAALKSEERTALLLKVKTAARNDAALQLTAEQQAKLDAEIRALRK